MQGMEPVRVSNRPSHRVVLLAAPRGYCAGVERAVEAVERALDKHGAPVYVRKQIVHNLHVVRDLEAKGAIFVDEIDQVPVGAVAVLSAHGSPPSVYEEAGLRELRLIDATCPLVTKVHVEARRFAGEGRTIVLIGHAGHEEVEGTSGQAPERTVLVQDLEDAAQVELPTGPIAYLTQTTLSVDETGQIVEALKGRYPELQPPPREDICYATQNRQDAVKAIAPRADVVLVIGSKNSSNSNRLAEVARELAADRVDLLEDDAAPRLPRLGDAGEDVPSAREQGNPVDLFHPRERLADVYRLADRGLDVDVAGVGEDLRRRHGDAEQPCAIRGNDGSGDRLHDAGDLMDLGEHAVADLIERRTPRVEQEVPLADRGHDALDPRLRREPGEHVRHGPRGDPDVDVRIHPPAG